VDNSQSEPILYPYAMPGFTKKKKLTALVAPG